MFNLFDILQSQNGAGLQSLGQPFGLSPEQSRRAVEALLPAFTIGLQKNAAIDPTGFARMFGFAGASQPGAGGRPDQLFGPLFASPALSQAVLQQAAAASGIGTQALRQILPVMAGMIVAGIVHMMLNQPGGAAQPTQPPPPKQPDFPAMNFWNDWLNAFLASGETKPDVKAGPAPAPARRPEPAPLPPLPAPTPAEKVADQADKQEPAANVSTEVFQHMFETGVQVQEQNVKAMQDIFDTFWSSGAKPDETAPVVAQTEAKPAEPVRRPRKPTKKASKPG